MKHHLRTLACGAALLAAFTLIACGGRRTTASRSAAAYDEAKKKGVPIAAGEHGGHTAEQETAATIDHDAMPEMDHSKMSHMDHSTMPEMDHSAMPGMDHSDMPAMDHSNMAGMQHGAPAPPMVIAPPASNAAIAQTRPATTLRPDEFDAPAPAAVGEAAKAAGGMSHSMHHGGGEGS